MGKSDSGRFVPFGYGQFTRVAAEIAQLGLAAYRNAGVKRSATVFDGAIANSCLVARQW